MRHILPDFKAQKKEEVGKLAQLGCTNKEIGFILDICPQSVVNHFKGSLNYGRAHLRTAIRKAQIELAIKDKNPTMLIWLGKNYLDQREPKAHVEHSGGVNVEKVMFGTYEKDKDTESNA